MRPARRRRGFSLIEVTIAGALLAVGATAVLSGYRTAMGLIEHQRRLVEGVSVSTAKLEELLRILGTDTALVDGPHGPEFFDQYARPVVAATPQTYTVNWTIGNGPSPGYVLVSVETAWTESTGQIRNTRMTAFRER